MAISQLRYDLIFAKCDDLRKDWLLTGEGEMFQGKVGKQGENQRSSPGHRLEEERLSYATEHCSLLSMYAWGNRMTPDCIEENDFLVIDTTIEPEKGDYVYRKGADGPEIARYQETDPAPIGVLIALKRTYR